jgi:hypothetical protein
MSDLAGLITEAIAIKKGDHEFCLYYHAEKYWTASIGNTSIHVFIGESAPEFCAEANTPEEAVAILIHMLKVVPH